MSEDQGKRRIVVDQGAGDKQEVTRDILVVVSKLKNYIKEKHGLNTSEAVAERLSDIIRSRCDEAAVWARSDGRKTLMDRDFK